MEEAELARQVRAIRNAKSRLPLGARVKMTRYAANMFPRYKGVLGTIVGHISHGTGGSPRVLWDGRKTDSSYAPWFILRVREKP